MRLDPFTLMATICITSIVVGVLQLFSWQQDRRIEALRWWSASSFLIALGALLVLLGGPNMWSLGRELGNAFLVLGAMTGFGAARSFNRKPILWPLLVLPSALWCTIVWTFELGFVGRIILNSLLFGSCMLATARELWTGPDGLASQRAAAVCSLIAALYMFSRILIGPYFLPSLGWMSATSPTWAVLTCLIIDLHVLISGFLSVSMAKEKVDLDHRRAALLDPLTGVANRRSFMRDGEHCVAENLANGWPATLIMFDLDHFKQINDEHGHLAGDQVLVAFCALATARLPAGALFCRLGGEEFAALLPRVGKRQAAETAELIREDLIRQGGRLVDCQVRATVSAGIATVERGRESLSDLLAAADAALYRAKDGGRNRIVVELACRTNAQATAPTTAPATA